MSTVMHRGLFAIGLLTLSACGSKTDAGSSSASASASSASASAGDASHIPKAAPGKGFVDPPLGEADAIEPPSRAVVPGVPVAVAKEKGAKPDGADDRMSLGPETDVWIEKELDIVSSVDVEYTAKDWETKKQTWGEPTIGKDTWVGKNWMATLSGCANGPCVVTFVRSPASFLDTAIRPPKALGNLKGGMTASQVKDATGFALPEDRSNTGFGWSLSVDYRNERLVGFNMDLTRGSYEEWLPMLVKAWGEPTALGTDKVWINPTDGWLVQFGYAGILLRFFPMWQTSDLIAKTGEHSIVAIAKGLLGQNKKALEKVPFWDAKDEQFNTFPSELSLRNVGMFAYDEDATINAVELTLHVENPSDMAKVTKTIEAAWGTLKKEKDEDGKDVLGVTVDGMRAQVDKTSDTIVITLER